MAGMAIVLVLRARVIPETPQGHERKPLASGEQAPFRQAFSLS